MELMPDEKLLMESDNHELALTTHRVRFEGKRWGGGQITSIMLENLTSCEITHATRPFLLAIAGLIVVFLLSKTGDMMAGAFLGGLLLAGGFVIAYYLTRRQVICLSSARDALRNPPDVGQFLPYKPNLSQGR